jgi:hypothetical protein
MENNILNSDDTRWVEQCLITNAQQKILDNEWKTVTENDEAWGQQSQGEEDNVPRTSAAEINTADGHATTQVGIINFRLQLVEGCFMRIVHATNALRNLVYDEQ